ncbi:T9SS type A sorting domain-containing protein, partial [bacterium AH-315-F03]|nr:T9SS type A sorting domain-containing protein [bacterium AH-315-F03]
GTAFANFQWAPLDLDSGISTISFIATDYWGASDTATTTVVVTIGATFTLSLSIDTAYPGELVQIAVALKNREAISGFELVVHVDPSVMSVLSISSAASRASDFESFLYLFNVPTLGDIRISGSASEGLSLPPGDGPLFVMNTLISTQVGLAGLFLPVNFVFRVGADPNDNTMTDEDGVQITVSEIVYVNGGTKVKEPAAINRGDINLNGIPFEVADALRFTNYFIDPTGFGFDAQQYANSDVNEDGIVASVADLVTLLAIVTGASSSRIIPNFESLYESSKETQAIFIRESSANADALTLGSEVAVGGVYFEASIAKSAYISESQEIFRLSEAALAKEMIIDQRYDRNNNSVRVLIYSFENGALPASGYGITTELVSWDNREIPVVSFENIEVSSADGALLEVGYSFVANEAILPNSFSLSQNYPNPFNPSTKILFSLGSESAVTLVVYDVLGRTVTTLAQGNFVAGTHEVFWDGSDSHGSVVASGVYFYRLKSGEKTLTRKMALLK